MTSINQQVWQILRKDLAAKKDISRGVINTRALARYILENYDMDASLDAVISAIRRFREKEVFEEEEEKLKNVFEGAVINTKNNIACITTGILETDFFNRVCNVDGDIPFKITTGKNELKIMVENPRLSRVRGMFKDDEIIEVDDELSEISVKLEEIAIQTKGVLARIASELALADINIEEVIIVPPEFLIYVKQDDIVRAHDSMLKLAQGEK